MGPLGEAASVAAHHSPCARPLTGHTVHSRAHARSPRASPRHAALPLCRQSLAIRTLCLPARRRLSRCDPRGLAGARDTCGQQPISRRVLRDGACGRGRSASVHVVLAVRRGGTSPLPEAHSGEKGASAAAMWGTVGVVSRNVYRSNYECEGEKWIKVRS